MNLNGIRNIITSKMGRQLLVAQKNSPTMMVVAGTVGFVGTVVLASRATLKLDAVLQETETNVEKAKWLLEQDRDDYTKRDYQQDMTLLTVRTAGKVAKIYAPAFVVGAASLACFIGSHKIMSNRNAGLMAAYAAMDKAFREYRERVLKEVGEDKEREFRYGSVDKQVLEETETGPQVKTVKRVDPKTGPSMYARFFDESNKNWNGNPHYNKMFLLSNQQYMNDLLISRGHVFLNDVYDALGFERTPAGSVVGWILGVGDDYIDFGIFDEERKAVREFVNGDEASILLDFNVCGVMYDKIGGRN